MKRLWNLLLMFHMLEYGIVLGAIAGFLFILTGTLTLSGLPLNIMLINIFNITITSAFVGGLGGSIFGGLAGLLSAIVMALVTAVAYRDIHHVRRFKLVMGVITAGVTGWVLFNDILLEFSTGMEVTWLGAVVVSVMIAVYTSQIVAQRYINATLLRKQKSSC